MAYIVDFAITENSAGGGTSPIAANVPAHQADDYLIMFASVNGSAGGTSGNTNSGITVTGWTQIGTFQIANAGIASSVYFVKATTSTTTCSVAVTTMDDYTIKVVSVRDADLTTFLDGTVSSNSGTTAVSEWTSPQFATTQNDSLVFYYHAFDGQTPMAHSDAGTMFLISSDSTGATPQTSAGSAIAWYIQRSFGTVPAASWSASISTQRTNHCFAVRNKAGGIIPPYIDDTTTQATRLHSGLHTGTLNNTVVSTTMTATASINGKTMGTSAATLGADFGINPYSNALGNTGAIVARAALSGYQIALTGGRDLSTGLIVGSLIARTPKEARYGIGATAEGGVVCRIGNTATQWNSYQLAAKDAVQTLETRSLFAIQAGYTGTTYGATQGTTVAPATVAFIQFHYNAPLFASIAYFTDLYQVFKTTAAGGTATAPVDLDGLAKIGNSYRLPLIRETGSSILSYTPIQIGGGDAVNFQVDRGTIQFPGRNNAVTRDLGYHAADNALGLSLAGKSGDTVYLKNSVITSPTPYYFEINASATSAALWDLTGTTVTGANVTLRPVITFSNMSFTNCPSLIASACTITDCVIDLVATTGNPLTITSTTSITASTFNTTALSAGVGLVSVNQATRVAGALPISNCTFTGSSTTGHAIVITQAGSYTFNNLTFNGYGGTPGDNPNPGTGSTSAAIYNNSGGAVIINYTGPAFPSVRNGASSTTDIQGSAQVTLTGLKDSTEVRAYVGTDPATSVQIAEIDDGILTGGNFSFTQSYSGQTGYIQIFNVNYQPVRLDITYASTDVSIPVQQIVDRNYQP